MCLDQAPFSVIPAPNGTAALVFLPRVSQEVPATCPASDPGPDTHLLCSRDRSTEACRRFSQAHGVGMARSMASPCSPDQQSVPCQAQGRAGAMPSQHSIRHRCCAGTLGGLRGSWEPPSLAWSCSVARL